MLKIIFPILLTCFLLTACSAQQRITNTPAAVTVSPGELSILVGQWTGKLTYLDYQSGQPYTMSANMLVTQDSLVPANLLLKYEYPREPQANSTSTFNITDAGTRLDEGRLINKTLSNDSLTLVTELAGMDDNKSGLIRHTYIITPHTFIMRKEFRQDGTAVFIRRNEFNQSR